MPTLSEESTWAVVDSFFKEKGLVRQQIESFDEFLTHTLQDIIDDTPPLTVHAPRSSTSGSVGLGKLHVVEFGKITLSAPTISEADGSTEILFPQEARLRNLTYAAPLYVEMRKVTKVPMDFAGVVDGAVKWTSENDDVPFQRVLLGRMPIMLKSTYCSLTNSTEHEATQAGECPYDQGGYFIITGSEKVLIAQERMSTNYVYVFAKAPPAAFSFSAEIRSQAEKGSRHMSSLFVKLLAPRTGERGAAGQPVRTSLPYIKSDIPVVTVFRALGVVPDKDILGYISGDRDDPELMKMAMASLDEGAWSYDRDDCLEYIGKRAINRLPTRERRVRYATDILQREFLPHVGNTRGLEEEKARFFGYIIRRLIGASLGRWSVDDRDHFGKKRLDLAGPLLSSIFKSLFKKLTKEMYKYLQKVCLAEHQQLTCLYLLHYLGRGIE